MADNVEKRKIIIEAETKGFETAEKKIERLTQEMKELEKANDKAKREIKKGLVSEKGMFFKKMHMDRRRAQITEFKSQIRDTKRQARQMAKIREKADSVELKRMYDKEATIARRTQEIRDGWAKKKKDYRANYLTGQNKRIKGAVSSITNKPVQLEQMRAFYSNLEKQKATDFGFRKNSGYAGKIHEPFGATALEKRRANNILQSQKAIAKKYGIKEASNKMVLNPSESDFNKNITARQKVIAKKYGLTSQSNKMILNPSESGFLKNVAEQKKAFLKQTGFKATSGYAGKIQEPFGATALENKRKEDSILAEAMARGRANAEFQRKQKDAQELAKSNEAILKAKKAEEEAYISVGEAYMKKQREDQDLADAMARGRINSEFKRRKAEEEATIKRINEANIAKKKEEEGFISVGEAYLKKKREDEELAELMARGRENARIQREKATLKEQQIAKEKEIMNSKAEEARLAKQGAEIESNYIKSKKRMQAYAKKGRASKRKFDAGNVAPLSFMEQMMGADPKRKNHWWNAGLGAGLQNADRGFEKVANSAMMAVGQLTMVGGAFMMLTMSGAMAFQKIMAIGDALASVEKDFLTSAGVRSQMIRSGGNIAGFDAVVKKEMAISGRNKYQSGAFLGRASNTLRNYGGVVNSNSLENLMTGAHGLAGLQGIESEDAMGKIIDLAKSGKGKDATKLGLQELKLTKNMNENLQIIADAMLRDPIASTILKRGTIGSSMNRIRSAPGELAGNVMEKYQGMIHSTFQRIGDNIFGAFASDESREIFARVFKNFEIVTSNILTQENIQKAINGLAQWSAELINLGGWVLKGTLWFLENSDKVIYWTEKAMWFFGIFQATKLVIGFGTFVKGIIQIVGWAKVLAGAIGGAIGKVATAGTVGTGLGGLLARGGIGAVLKGGAGLAMGALMNPWTLGALAIGGAGYLGYKWYQGKKQEADAIKGAGQINLGTTINPMQLNPQANYHDDPTATALVGGSYIKLNDMAQILVAPNGFTVSKDVGAETQSIIDY